MKKRQRLDIRIEKHHETAERYLPSGVVDHISDTADNEIDDGWEDVEEDSSEDPPGFTFSVPCPSQQTTEAEKKHLFLPSSIGFEKCSRLGLKLLAEKEMLLREGQANDALQAIRLAIGEKSFRFRKQLRTAKSKVKKTRSWDLIKSASKQLQHHRLIYRQARQSMVNLGASPQVLKKYQELTDEDIRTSTAIEEPNARGQRNTELSWIWKLPGVTFDDKQCFTKECENHTFQLFYRNAYIS